MDGGRVSKAAPGADHGGKRKKRAPGLQVKARDGYWHLVGTIRVNGRSVRVRESTGLPAGPETWQDADDLRVKKEGDARQEAIHGIRPSVPLAVALYGFLNLKRQTPLHYIDIGRLKEVAVKFGTRVLNTISEDEWNDFIDKRHAGNKAETRERHLNIIVAFLNWCVEKPQRYIAEVPAFNRNKAARNPKQRNKRRVQELTLDLLQFMIERAAPHLRGQLAAEWSTGGRVSSIIYGCRLCDLILAEGRESITFHETKNGRSVTASLTPWAAEQLRAYIKWRGKLHDREAPLFLTHARKPYSEDSSMYSGHNKTAFKGMRRRAAAAAIAAAKATADELIAAEKYEEADEAMAAGKSKADLIGKITQHWFRHNLATTLLARGASIRDIMDQAGWLDPKSVLGYAHDVPEVRRRKVNLLEETPEAGPKEADQAKQA